MWLQLALLCAESNCSVTSVKDVVFVVDMSGSIGSSNFQLIRDFISDISAELIHNSPRSAVGVILFSNRARIQFNLQAHTNLSTLLPAINQLPYNGGSTDTHEALQLLLTSAQNGRLGLRNSSSKVAIIITDGKSSNRQRTLSAATALHDLNIFDIYAVGVDGADKIELEKIASIPEYVFFTNSFDNSALQSLLNSVLNRLCTPNSKHKIDSFCEYLHTHLVVIFLVYVCTWILLL